MTTVRLRAGSCLGWLVLASLLTIHTAGWCEDADVGVRLLRFPSPWLFGHNQVITMPWSFLVRQTSNRQLALTIRSASGQQSRQFYTVNDNGSVRDLSHSAWLRSRVLSTAQNVVQLPSSSQAAAASLGHEGHVYPRTGQAWGFA